MLIEVLYFPDCPNHGPTLELAKQAVGELEVQAEVREVRVETIEEAERRRFLGSPSVRVNGEDIEPDARLRTDFALSCRIYGQRGVPPRELVVGAIREASNHATLAERGADG